MTVDLSNWRGVFEPYGSWLNRHGVERSKHWADRLNSADASAIEGAAAEAVTWDYLRHRVEGVALGGAAGADYHCHSNGSSFLVEVTNISLDTATARTGLKQWPTGGATCYGDLTQQVFSKVRTKAAQLREIDEPLVVFVTTFHFNVSALCVCRQHLGDLLTGKSGLGFLIDVERGETIGGPWNTHDPSLALFHRPSQIVLPGESEPRVEVVRRHISSVLIGGFGLRPPDAHVLGVLHPDPIRGFDSEWIRGVPFGRVQGLRTLGGPRVEWSDEQEVTPAPPAPRVVMASEIDYGDL